MLIGTICSGTDLVQESLKFFAAVFEDLIGKPTPIHMAFACESSPIAIRWLKKNLPPTILFEDAEQLHHDQAMDLMTETHVEVPTEPPQPDHRWHRTRLVGLVLSQPIHLKLVARVLCQPIGAAVIVLHSRLGSDTERALL